MVNIYNKIYKQMQKVQSKQFDIKFLFCSSPITIDKSESWGEGNFQEAPNGAFLKTSSETEISHLVQPNANKTAPIGWIPSETAGLFDKEPIWVDDKKVFHSGQVIELETLDGKITYEVKEPTMLCYNDLDGEPNMKDVWAQSIAQIDKNYLLKL